MGFRPVYGQIIKIAEIIKNVEKWQIKTWPWGPLKGRQRKIDRAPDKNSALARPHFWNVWIDF